MKDFTIWLCYGDNGGLYFKAFNGPEIFRVCLWKVSFVIYQMDVEKAIWALNQEIKEQRETLHQLAERTINGNGCCHH